MTRRIGDHVTVRRAPECGRPVSQATIERVHHAVPRRGGCTHTMYWLRCDDGTANYYSDEDFLVEEWN